MPEPSPSTQAHQLLTLDGELSLLTDFQTQIKVLEINSWNKMKKNLLQIQF